MVILDANAILRYLLEDDKEMALKAEKVIESRKALVTIEVISEVVYVLKRVYNVSKNEVKTSLLSFLSEVEVQEREILILGIETYAEQNIDFVDCILYAYKKIKDYDIFTFDRKLNKLLSSASK